MTTTERPNIEHVKKCAIDNIDTPHHCPISKNKGAAGLLFEQLAGIPTSSACLDCLDGEVKVFPLKKLKNGKIVPKETVAITMMNPEDLDTISWNESRCCKKINNVLFVGYLRDGDNIIIKKVFLMNEESEPELYKTFQNDYETIQNIWKTEKRISAKTGTLIQSRTKGPGGNKKKTRAFYFRPTLMKKFL
jgi:DNA mismatch repair protein MutH